MNAHPLKKTLVLLALGSTLTGSTFAQSGTYMIDPTYFAGHLDLGSNYIGNWDYSDVNLVIREDLTAYLEGTITAAGVADSYYLRFDFVDPYSNGRLYEPDLMWGDYSGSLTNLTTNQVTDRYFDYNGSGRGNWGSTFDAAFGEKRAEQGGNHPAPWTNGSSPNGSLEFGFWSSNSQGVRNGDLNTTVKAIPEPGSVLLIGLAGLAGLVRRRRN